MTVLICPTVDDSDAVVGNAAAASAKDSSAVSGLTAQKEQVSSPDGKLKPIPRRNLSEAFEAMCSDLGSGEHQD